jgi:hypothetical protein
MAPTSKAPQSLIGRVVTHAQFHTGVGHVPRTGYDAKRDDAYMEIQPTGVYVKKKEGEFLVPYSNVLWCRFAEVEK